MGRPPSRAGGGSKLPTPVRPSSRAGQNPRRSSAAYSVGPDGGLSPPRAPSPAHSVASTTLSSGPSYWRGAPTPEPQLAAQAKRMSFLRQPQAKAPPMPALPANWRSTSGASVGSRPPSRGAAAKSSSAGTGPVTFPATYPAGSYQPNPADPLDCAVAAVVNGLPMGVSVRRVDVHWTRAEVGQRETFQARYAIGGGRGEEEGEAGKTVVCKLVERLGPRGREKEAGSGAKGGKKVVVQVGRGLGAGWQELEGHCLGVMARGV